MLEIEIERQSILDRLKAIKAPKKKTEAKDIPLRGHTTALRTPVTPQEKIELFLTLFRCRESVFPKLWENPKKNIKGYSPVCRNEWAERLCGHQNFPPLDASAVKTHLEGASTIGTYAIRQDDTCAFLLACDFGVRQFLGHLLKHLRGPVIVIWDNAKIHKGESIRELLRRHRRLYLEALPPYTPELNPDGGYGATPREDSPTDARLTRRVCWVK